MVDRTTGVDVHVGFRVKALQQVFRVAMDSALQEAAISTSQYAVLTAIRDLPGASGAALAARTFMTPQSLNESLAGLEQRGLVARTPHPTHGRIIEARLTPEGAAALRKGEAIVFGIEEQMLAPLLPVQREALSDMLDGCRKALADATLNPRRSASR